MTLLEQVVRDLRINIADQFEKRRFAGIKYTGSKYNTAHIEITTTYIDLIFDKDDSTPVYNKIVFDNTTTLLDVLKQYGEIEDVEMDLDSHIVASFVINGLFYQKLISIVFGDDDDISEDDCLDLYVGTFYPNYVYEMAISNATALVKEGYTLDELEGGDLVYVKWIATAELCRKRSASILETVSKLVVIDKETINLEKITVTKDTSLSQDAQSIAKYWMDMAKQYEDLAKDILENQTASLPEVVVGKKTFEDSITGNEMPTRNVDVNKKITLKNEKWSNDLVFNWTQVKGADFKEYRLYMSNSDFYVSF